ncbi:NUDIX domain-containing protein [Myceligenerans xiligouense]|uniref:ADP-ribose pyrophosphatase YjhB (NUDIX family) n=1 Tax=Myceligenerans xiligouense TaxID=253184 RepID=A0A3N4YLB9_9MICO|nr:NUDIX hydrolase [Myceligenerans xiligouense]RPF21483.1 ADP-ribose pyrophosphatase YjhB (NUDIX family) [Myceligenerans xiligouense]
MTWVEPEKWYAQLASFHAAAALFLTDDAGRILLVKPTYRDHWAFPGGYVDQDETPHTAAARELSEELGLALPIGDLLVIDWASPAGPRPRALINFVFDGGRLPDAHHMRMDTDELETFGFHDPEYCKRLLPARVAPRIDAALDARAKNATTYLIDGEPTPPKR